MTSQGDPVLSSRTLGLVVDAIDIVMRRLEGLKPCPDVQALRAAALRQLHEAQGWERAWPAPEQQERLLKCVVALHVGTARLEQQGPYRPQRPSSDSISPAA